MIIKQISVFVENKAGRLAEITALLAEAKVDIRALSVADTNDFGILRLIVNDPDKAEAVLRGHGYTVAMTKVIAIGIHDQPGGLATPMKALYENGISVEYMYAFISKTSDTAYVILRVENNDRAIQVLQNTGVKLVSEDEVYGM